MVAQLRTACCTLPASIYFEFMYVNWIWTATPGRGCAHCMAVMCALRFDGILIVSFNWKFNFKCYFLFCAATKRNWQCRQTKPSGTNGPYRSKSIWFGCFLSIFLTFFISFSAQFCDFRIAPKNFGNRNLKMYDSYEWLRQRLSSRKSEKKIIWISLDRFKTKWPFLDTVNIAMANCWPHTPQDDHKWLAWAHNSRLIFGKKKTNYIHRNFSIQRWRGCAAQTTPAYISMSRTTQRSRQRKDFAISVCNAWVYCTPSADIPMKRRWRTLKCVLERLHNLIEVTANIKQISHTTIDRNRESTTFARTFA